jgi:Asp-tRNA(Asn)/Glu-tRNA(Gln) amidotransferase A subunit family amidase
MSSYPSITGMQAKLQLLTIHVYCSDGLCQTGAPIGITFISRPFEEDKLLKIGYAFEQGTKARKLPKDYK